MSWDWAKIKALFRRAVEKAASAPATTAFPFEYSTLRPPMLPKLDSITGITTTVHSRTVITESVECSVSPTPEHDIQIVIVDNVVKTISSPCDRTSALAAAQLGGASCAHRYLEICSDLRGDPKPYRPARRYQNNHLAHAFEASRLLRTQRGQRRLAPTSAFPSRSVWESFIRQTTGLSARVAVYGSDGQQVRVLVETPGVESRYTFTGAVWALSQGPGDQRVYDLLNRYVKLNSKLVRHL